MFLILFTFSFAVCVVKPAEVPIIGILAQEATAFEDVYDGADSVIAASYVKFLEGSGARVLPIWINQDEAYYARVVEYTNGVLFPGGGIDFYTPGGYGDAAYYIYKLAIDANNKGIPYPLWGTCLGMQVLAFTAMDGEDITKPCSAEDVALRLNFVTSNNESRLFSKATPQLLNKLETKNITYNSHQFCLFEDVLEENNLLNEWRIISKNLDLQGTEFISAMENKEYPFYGIQFHPEKSNFEFKSPTAVPHYQDAIDVSQYFANFFVEECKKNNNSFANPDLEMKALIYNYNPVYSALNTSYEQMYLFTLEDYVNNQLI